MKNEIMQGVWMPHSRGFLKTCPVCNDEFIGRKNKTYCTLVCKNRFHNDNNAEVRAEERLMSKSLINNERILASYFLETDERRVSVSLNELTAKGFDMNGQNTEVKDNAEKSWFKVVNHAFDQTQTIKW